MVQSHQSKECNTLHGERILVVQAREPYAHSHPQLQISSSPVEFIKFLEKLLTIQIEIDENFERYWQDINFRLKTLCQKFDECVSQNGVPPLSMGALVEHSNAVTFEKLHVLQRTLQPVRTHPLQCMLGMHPWGTKRAKKTLQPSKIVKKVNYYL